MKYTPHRLALLIVASMLTTGCGLFSNPGYHHRTEPSVGHDLMLIGALGGTEQGGTIQSFSIDPGTLHAEHTGKVHTPSPTFMTISKKTGVLYVTNETREQATVSAYRLNKISGELTLLNQSYTLGSEPTYVSTIDDKVLTANYGSGSITLFNTDKEGKLEQADWRIELGTAGISHPHAVVLAPNGRELFVPDLGQDKVFHFNVSRSTPPLTIDTEHTSLSKGTGPRHIILDDSGQHAYLIAEHSPRIYVYRHNNGQLTPLQTIDTGTHSVGAHIAISHDGRHLYASFRDPNPGIISYEIDQDGKLSEVGFFPTGLHPRHFALSPTDDYLAVASRDSNQVQVFVCDKTTGKLSRSKLTIKVTKPVFVLWQRF